MLILYLIQTGYINDLGEFYAETPQIRKSSSPAGLSFDHITYRRPESVFVTAGRAESA